MQSCREVDYTFQVRNCVDLSPSVGSFHEVARYFRVETALLETLNLQLRKHVFLQCDENVKSIQATENNNVC